MRPISDYCTHKAVIFDNDNRHLTTKKIGFKESFFSYKGRSYNFIPNISLKFKRVGLFSTTKYYFYNYNNPMPLTSSGSNIVPVLDPQVYKRTLENKLIKDLNDLAKTSLFDILFQPKNLIILLVLIGGLVYFTSGGTIS